MAKKETAPIPQRELMAYRTELKGEIFRQIYHRFHEMKEQGFTQRRIAQLLDMDEGQLSRLLKGESAFLIDTLCDLARALNCRIVAQLESLQPISMDTASVKIGQFIEVTDPNPTLTAREWKRVKSFESGSLLPKE